MRGVKFSALLLLLAALSLAACTTDANRRELYRAKKGEGYWTDSLKTGSWKQRDVKDAQLPEERKKSVRSRSVKGA